MEHFVNRLEDRRFSIAAAAASLPAPTTATDGVAVPRIMGAYRSRYMLLVFNNANSAQTTILSAGIIHTYDGTRWRAAAPLNAGNPVDAQIGLEIEIPWAGGERIDISGALSGTLQQITIDGIPLEVI